jgi:hypothetical protein
MWGGFPSLDDSPGDGETTLEILDPIYHLTGLGRVLCELKGYPDQVNRVALGYRYPLAQANYTIDGTSTINLVNTANLGPTGILYFEILWRAQ